ncbi:peptidoglycan/LPS O-acetylase OafA/YrhL [Microbacterium sp. SLBN-154]|uniref:acyltransferase family protein n=1 Tax=Microbacterium sp. SLBN-154 TaxID=2768458 RepID=UPI0011517946|nr:acyltransferase family protein [Microbacterium sp. SLBN-154]TQK19009.1 peptidoglycan/LPS O-acetylase OafA/YrhL [Microbacterium sp. SLBN-154]
MTVLERSPTVLLEARAPKSPYRADIDGLRALAIALVVAYHVWFGRVSGGVDVFLMISAFFMTASFARRAETRSTEPVLAYWLRRFARLLPAAVVTIGGILITASVVFPPSSWPEIWSQSWASLFYFQNWELVASAADYYDRETLSPLQHFWSLSIQGQVFLLWPLLMVFAVALGRAVSMSVTRALSVLFVSVFIGSLTYSISFTAADQQAAYFDTFARLWEFALGSLLALVVARLRLPRWPAVFIGWLGIIGLVLCGALLDVQGGFPGYLALWPTLSAAAVIVAGTASPAGGPTRLLSSWPLRRLSAISYALYLVHWPILVTWILVTQDVTLDLLSGTAVVGLSLAVAVVVTYGVEWPLRRLNGDGLLRSSLTILVSVLLVTVPLVTWQSAEERRVAALPVGDHPGARVLMPGGANLEVDEESIVPAGSAVSTDWVTLDGECTGDRRPSEEILVETCREQTVEWRSTGTVFVIGDSHAQQWAGSLVPLADERDWNVVALLKGGCSFAAGEPVLGDRSECELWREAALDYALAHEPDLVFMMGTKTEPETDAERVLRGLDDYVQPIVDNGSEVVLVRDNPRFSQDMFACVELNGPDADECRRDARSVLAEENPAERLHSGGVTVVDLTPYLCPEGVCLPVIGGVAVYIDHGHIGQTYAETIAPALEETIRPVLERSGI